MKEYRVERTLVEKHCTEHIHLIDALIELEEELAIRRLTI